MKARWIYIPKNAEYKDKVEVLQTLKKAAAELEMELVKEKCGGK